MPCIIQVLNLLPIYHEFLATPLDMIMICLVPLLPLYGKLMPGGISIVSYDYEWMSDTMKEFPPVITWEGVGEGDLESPKNLSNFQGVGEQSRAEQSRALVTRRLRDWLGNRTALDLCRATPLTHILSLSLSQHPLGGVR